MRKKFVLLFLLFFISLLNVNALEVGDTVGHHYYFDTGITTGRGPSGGVSYFRHKIKETNEDLVCATPGAGSPNNLLKVKKIYGLEDKNIASFAAGYESIMSNINSNEDYVAATLAARAFIYMYYVNKVNPQFNMSYQGGTMDQYIVAVYYYRKWFDDYESSIKKALNKTSVTKGNASLLFGTIHSKSYISNAKSRFKKALTAASNARTNFSNGGVTINKATTAYNEDKTLATSITKIELKDVKENVYLTYSCDNCPGNVSYANNVEISTDNKVTWKSLANTDKGRLLGKGTKTIYIKTTFVKASSYDCSPIKYSMIIRGSGASNVVAVLEYSDGSSNRGHQHFIGLLKDSSGKGNKLAERVQPTINFCKTCEDYEKACNTNGPGSYACIEFEKEYDSNCAECTTLVNNVECSAETSTIKIVEGVAVSEESCTLTDSNKNVKNCVLNNRDISGNSYQAKTEGYPNNNYCKVYCTEDYDIEVPGIQSTNSGIYIKLSANVSGTKSCYTTEINREQFETDLSNRQQELIEAYKVFLKWKGAKDVLDSSGVSSETFPANSVCGGTYTNYFVKFTFDEVNSYNIDQTGQLTKFAVASNTGSDEVRSNGSPGTSLCHYELIGEKDGNPIYSCNPYCSSQPRDGSSTTVRNIITSSYNSAVRALETALSNLNKIIKEYNSCSGNILQGTNYKSANSTLWHMKYNFAPKVSFWYEDNHMELVKSIYLIGTSNLGSLNIENCNSSVDSYYNICDSSWIKNNSTSSAKNLLSCYKSGKHYICSSSAYNIADAKYVKQTQTASASYILPTQFYTVYPTGKIINDEKVSGTSPLENALPISLGTQAGVYTYTLNVEGLGEYYDSSKTGRIWGEEDSVVVTALEDENSCSYKLSASNLPNNNPAVRANDDGTYTCSYRVNCPGCNVTCGPDGCIWTECEDGHCIVKCDRCIFSNGEANFSYRPITTKDINPNNRELGANWNYDENNIKTTTELKAYATTNDILTKGEKVYESDSDDVVLSVKLTQTMIRDIKNYNDKYDNNGGYASNSLKCYDYKDKNNIVYENIYCYSTFVDEMAEKYSDNFKFTKDRISSEDVRKNVSNQCENGANCYWTTWTDALNDSNFRIATKIERFDPTKFTDYADGSGPSYR